MNYHTTTLNLFWEDKDSIGRMCQNKYYSNLTYKLAQFAISVW